MTDYKFSTQIKRLSIALIIIGAVGIAFGFYSAPSNVEEAKEIVASMSHGGDHGDGHGGDHGDGHGGDHGDSHGGDHGDSHGGGHEYDHDKHVFNQLHNKPWAAIYVPALFFMMISLGVLAFYAIQRAAQAGWSIVLYRIMEGITSYLLPGCIFVIIILVFSGILAGCVWRPLWKRVLILISLGTIVVTEIFLVNPGIEDRFINSFINAIPTGDHSDYYRVMGGGVIAFIEAPFFGIGTANYRELCKDILFVYENFRCDNHPHNYYIQLLAETGIFGLATGLLMVLSIIWHTVSTSLDNRKNVVVATAFIIPLGLFFPIASTADFFGQWNNIFIWSAISLSLGATNINKTKFNLK